MMKITKLLTNIFRKRKLYRLVLCVAAMWLVLHVCADIIWRNQQVWQPSLPDIMAEVEALKREMVILRNHGRNSSKDLHSFTVLNDIRRVDHTKKMDIPPTTGEQEFDISPHVIFAKGNVSCLAIGTNVSKMSHSVSGSPCVCKSGWYGKHCSIPQTVQASWRSTDDFEFRTSPRKLVVSFLYSNEYAMLMHRLMDTGDVVDSFLVTEGTFTGYGDRKNLTLLQELKSISCPTDIMDKIILDVMDYFPAKAASNGWLFESEARDHVFRNGMPPQMRNVSEEDIFLHTDADEVPSRDVLLFLKFHNNIPEPYMLNLQKTVYGFFWYSGEWQMHAGATFRMMREVFQMRPHLLRQKRYITDQKQLIHKYIANTTGAILGPIKIGTQKNPAGFHCSSCTPPSGIRTKMLSAINADFPRWGDYPMKNDLTYIRSLIAQGLVFSETKCMTAVPRNASYFAPIYISDHPEKFHFLLRNPYAPSRVVCKSSAKMITGVFLKNWHRMSRNQVKREMRKNNVSLSEELFSLLPNQ